MAFNLSFTSAKKEDIKVGYIDPSLGYVDGITICEANEYAKNNPGTTFIFRDGDNNIRYLSINEINKLTPKNLVSTTDECGGIQQYEECGPPRIQFFGGGGIGAAGNPVVGIDGSLLAVDLVSGGFGYQYEPIVAAKDNCQSGNGAVLVAVLGETADEIEVFEGEDDFEEYELCDDPNEINYGTRYGTNGEELGDWEPQIYTKVGGDPIRREIEIFQKALEKPFWTTRKVKPDRIFTLENELGSLGGTNQYPDSYDVTFPEWGEFMNEYAISPVKPSDTTGSDESSKIFSMEWELNFPISGEYIFRGVCDNSAQVYIDNVLVGQLRGFKDNPSPVQKTIQEGNHLLRIDLKNLAIFENVSTTTTSSTSSGSSDLKASFIQEGSSFYLQVDGSGSGEISFVMDVNDNPYTAGIAAEKVTIPADDGSVTLERDPFEQTGSDEGSGTFTGGKKYGPIEIIGAGASSRGPIINSKNRLGIRDADGDDENIKITIGNIQSTANEVTTTTTTSEIIISPKSWNENPMGVSMTIDAPIPPVPQEQIPPPVGECPPNPIWSTRFPGATEQWYPVRFDSWSNFMNRYAISPILPLNTAGSDISGVTFSNSWEVDLPYAGFYGVKGTRDNRGRILIDGIEVSSLDGFIVDNPKLSKIYLTKGRHTIVAEVFNEPIVTRSVIDTKIFSTQDWRVSYSESSVSPVSDLKASFIQEGSSFYLQVDGTGSGEISFVMDVNDNPYTAGIAAQEVIIPADDGEVKLERDPFEQTDSDEGSGTFTGGKKYGPIEIIGAGSGAKGPIINSKNRLGIRDADGDDENIKITIGNIQSTTNEVTTTTTSQTLTKNGVTYNGPKLFGHIDSRWSKYMNDISVSPEVFRSIGEPDENIIGKFTLTWSNVSFPYDGVYKFNFQADNNATLFVGGNQILKTSDFQGEKVQFIFNATAGKYDVTIELENVRPSDNNNNSQITFVDNPMGTALYISKDVVFQEKNKTPWTSNPTAISAILIPPPCAKKIGGKGVVEKVIIDDPGNGYLPPPEQGPGYPVTLVLDEVIVENPGINYNCGVDEIRITPSNGAQLSYSCDSFGRISKVNVENPGIGFNVYPEITMVSPPDSPTGPTGVNATFRPVFRVVRDPLLPPEQVDRIIQVTDLVGLKQTGYVDGRAYYGAVYYDEGIPFAGYYKTAGPQTRVYATLQESITAQVTTPASAIQRSGTDVTSNDPRLNIPGTIEDTQT